MVYCCVPECKIIHLGIHLSFNEIPHQESHKERYHAWLTKIRSDPGPLITTSLIEKCSCQLQGQLTKCGQLVDTFPWVFVTDMISNVD